jgi:hypothetical protein
MTLYPQTLTVKKLIKMGIFYYVIYITFLLPMIEISQDAIIRVLTYRRYANITVWYFFVFSHVPRRYTELLLSVYLLFAGTTWPFQAQGIQYRNLVGISCVWDVFTWNMIALMALRNVGVDCLYVQWTYSLMNKILIDLDRSRQTFHHSLKEHHKISNIPWSFVAKCCKMRII